MPKTLDDVVFEWLQEQYPNRYERLPNGLRTPLQDNFNRAVLRFLVNRCQIDGCTNQSRVSEVMGMNRNTVRKLIRELGVPVTYRNCDPDGHYAKYGKKPNATTSTSST